MSPSAVLFLHVISIPLTRFLPKMHHWYLSLPDLLIVTSAIIDWKCFIFSVSNQFLDTGIRDMEFGTHPFLSRCKMTCKASPLVWAIALLTRKVSSVWKRHQLSPNFPLCKSGGKKWQPLTHVAREGSNYWNSGSYMRQLSSDLRFC